MYTTRAFQQALICPKPMSGWRVRVGVKLLEIMQGTWALEVKSGQNWMGLGPLGLKSKVI
jgi:hypothetical protein